MTLTLCDQCATDRGAHGCHAARYLEKSIGIWRGRCDDCGAMGSSGDASGLRCYVVMPTDAPPPPSTMPDLSAGKERNEP